MEKYIPQHITVDDVKRACRTAIAFKRLQAQEGLRNSCMYRTPSGCGCAVGVTLTKKTIDEILSRGLNGVGVADLVDKGVITTDDLDEIECIQNHHDWWVNAIKGLFEQEKRQAFLRLIYR